VSCVPVVDAEYGLLLLEVWKEAEVGLVGPRIVQ